MDLTSAIDSPEATAVRKKTGQLQPEEVGDFLTTLSFGGLYMHGTHVAGIAVRGQSLRPGCWSRASPSTTTARPRP